MDLYRFVYQIFQMYTFDRFRMIQNGCNFGWTSGKTMSYRQEMSNFNLHLARSYQSENQLKNVRKAFSMSKTGWGLARERESETLKLFYCHVFSGEMQEAWKPNTACFLLLTQIEMVAKEFG